MVPKSWKRDYTRVSVQVGSFECLSSAGGDPNNCKTAYPSSASQSNVSVTAPSLADGIRVWDVTGAPQPVSACAGCPAGRFQIRAKTASGAPTYRVLVVTDDLSELAPDTTDAGNYQEYSFAAKGTTYSLTGLDYGTQKRCSGTITNNRPCPSCPIISQTCDKLETYHRWRALTAASIQLDAFKPSLRTSATATGDSLQHTADDKRPTMLQAPVLDLGPENVPTRFP